jgi:glucose/arabinose dehydrogenase
VTVRSLRAATILSVWLVGQSAIACESTPDAPTQTASDGPSLVAPSATAASSPADDDGDGAVRTGDVVAKLVAGDLERPAAFTVASDGTILYGERLTGEIRRFDPINDRDVAVTTVPGVVGEITNEQGLLGLTLSADGGSVYIYATRQTAAGLRNQILRARLGSDGHASRPRLLVDVMAAGERHNGGHLSFGPDGRLYVVTGESTQPALSQDGLAHAGKILRLSPTGSVPADGPIPDSAVFATGVRNSFGFAFDPETGHLWETENGPECNDEINRVPPGANLGWGPSAACTGDARGTNADGSDVVLPELAFERTVAPTGIAFCDGCDLGAEREGRLFYGTFNTGEIHEVTLGRSRRHIIADRVAYTHRNIVLSLESAPDGTLLFSDGTGIYHLALRRERD